MEREVKMMKIKVLLIAGILIFSGGILYAQEEAVETDLREEHKDYVQNQKDEKQKWQEDFNARRKAALDEYKAQGLSQKEIQEKMQEFRDEKGAYIKSKNQERREYMKEQRENNPGQGRTAAERKRDHIEEKLDRKEDVIDKSENRWDRREDVRDRNEDKRDRREDVRDRTEDVRDSKNDEIKEKRLGDLQGRYTNSNDPEQQKRLEKRIGRLEKNIKRDKKEDVLDKREDVKDRREDVRDKREDKRDKKENVRDRRENRRDRREDFSHKSPRSDRKQGQIRKNVHNSRVRKNK